MNNCCAVVAARKDLGDEYRDHVAKYSLILREPEIGLERAADYLDQWLSGALPKQPLFGLLGWAVDD